MEIQDYSEKAIVVRGEKTKDCKEGLMEMGGKFNAVLKGGPGYIFPKTKREAVQKFIDQGVVTKPTYEKKEFKAKYSVKENVSTPSDNILEKIEKKIDVLTSEISDLRLLLATLRSEKKVVSSSSSSSSSYQPEIVFEDEIQEEEKEIEEVEVFQEETKPKRKLLSKK